MEMTYTQKQQRLLDQEVAPWIEKLPWQATHPVSFDASEGYRGNGVFGARAGPWDSIDFENVAHEMAHAIEILEHGRTQALLVDGWGLRITSSVNIGGIDYIEPMSMQATEREARVCGIQWRILEMVGHTGVAGFASRHATTLGKFMPDWIFGGDSKEQRHRTRVRLIEESYHQWPAARVASAWIAAHPLLLDAQLQAQQAPENYPTRRRAPR